MRRPISIILVNPGKHTIIAFMELFFIFEIIGTVAFAISGALAAIRKKMDIFGVSILGMTTAVAGGIIRDIVLGITPPAAFVEPVYALTAIAVSLICAVLWPYSEPAAMIAGMGAIFVLRILAAVFKWSLPKA